jgi:hypothetical protein
MTLFVEETKAKERSFERKIGVKERSESLLASWAMVVLNLNRI